MQLLTATLLRPGASSSSVISTQPRERTAKHCQTQRRGWEVEGLSCNLRSVKTGHGGFAETRGVRLRMWWVGDLSED